MRKWICVLVLMLALLPAASLAEGDGTLDNSTSLADGAYVPDDFSFTGGTGRVSIRCDEVRVTDGHAEARIVFSSPNYSYVKAGGEVFYADHSEAESSFAIPVKLNADNIIIGQTTAMSTPHEVEYVIRVELAAALDGEGGELRGLTYESSMELTYATGFSVDYYEGGYKLIDIVDGDRYLVVPE